MQLHWLSGHTLLGLLGTLIGGGTMLIGGLWQCLNGLTRQNYEGTRTGILLLLMSLCMMSARMTESIPSLTLLCEILSGAGVAFSCLFVYFVVSARRRDTADKTASPNNAVPDDKIWPPPPTLLDDAGK